MCYGCYLDYGSPSIRNEKTEAAALLIAKVYSFSETGGNLHIHLDDWNIEDEYFEEFEIWRNDCSQEQVDADRACFDALKAMTLDERASAIAIHEGFFVDRQ